MDSRRLRRFGAMGVGVVACAAAGWFVWQAHAPSRPSTAVVDQPIGWVRLASRSGVALTEQRREPVLVLRSGEMPAWAIRQLAPISQPVVLRPVSWAQAARWRALSVPGVSVAQLAVIAPVPGLSPTVFRVLESEAQAWHTGRAHLGELSRWTPAVAPGRVRTTLSARLIRALAQSLPPAASAVVVGTDGRIEAIAANPLGRQAAWQPRPVGQALLPPLVAMALSDASIWSDLVQTSPLKWSLVVGRRWGAANLRRSLNTLGFTRYPTVLGQPVANPGLPAAMGHSGLAGRGLWATPLQMAYSYQPFIDGGKLPALTFGLQSVRTVAPRVLGSANNWRAVLQAMPTLYVGGQRWQVWRPNSSYAVAVRARARVVVVEGSALADLPHLLEVVQAQTQGARSPHG